MLMWTLVMWQVAAQAAPPPPSGREPAVRSAWACTRATLQSGALCVFDGKSAAQAPSKEASQETARAASALLNELCAEAARTAGTPEPSVLAVCTRADRTLAGACDHGGVRLLDDEGRFNPGHAPCYTALRAAIERAEATRDDARTCCGCAADRCGLDVATCTARIAALRPLDAPCAQTCASACVAASTRATFDAPKPARTP